MAIKRVITGIDADGKSVFKAAGTAPHVMRMPTGLELTELFRLPRIPQRADEGAEVPFDGVSGPPGSILFRVCELPPDAEVFRRLPEIAAQMGGNSIVSLDEATYGMHDSPTIDFVTIIEGECDLRLADGSEEHLKPGDSVIQGGAMHAWRNRGSTRCLLSAVVVALKPA
jgi:hypothetical protein